MELFARGGIDATAIEEITEHAGYSRGAFYSNFGDKDDLLCALIEREIERDHEEMSQLFTPDLPLSERLKVLRQYYLDYGTQKNKCLFWLDVQLYTLRHKTLRPRIAELMRKDRDLVAEFIRQLYRDLGIDPPGPPEALTSGFISLGQGLTMLQALDPEALTPELISTTLGLFYDKVTNPTT